MNVRLAPGLLEEIVHHAEACYPNEGCGLLAGKAHAAERFVPMENTKASDTEFEMDPRQLVQQLRAFREAGQELVAIYHSHPRGPAGPSRRDVVRAYYPDAASIIVSLADLKSPQVAAFRITGGEVLEVELHVIV